MTRPAEPPPERETPPPGAASSGAPTERNPLPTLPGGSEPPATQPHERPLLPGETGPLPPLTPPAAVTEPNPVPPPVAPAPAARTTPRPAVRPATPSPVQPVPSRPPEPPPAVPRVTPAPPPRVAQQHRAAQPPPTPPLAEPPPNIDISGRVGGDVIGRDRVTNTTAGRDVVGRDIVTTNNTTNVGFSAAAVQRLLITVGMLVFVTAACFFSGGVVVGGAALAALNKPVDSGNPQLAAEFADVLAQLRGLPPGHETTVAFSEEQISAYFQQVVAPTLPLDITQGKVRLLGDRQLVIGGNAGDLGNVNFAATFDWQSTPGQPLRLTSAAVEALPLHSTAFGWVAVPTIVLRPIETNLNALFGNVQLTDVQASPGPVWEVTAVGQ